MILEDKHGKPPEAPTEEPTSTQPRNAKERLYEKLPFTYRQVDIFVKIMIALVAVVLLVGILAGR